jgi:hypothetical protein
MPLTLPFSVMPFELVLLPPLLAAEPRFSFTPHCRRQPPFYFTPPMLAAADIGRTAADADTPACLFRFAFATPADYHAIFPV